MPGSGAGLILKSAGQGLASQRQGLIHPILTQGAWDMPPAARAAHHLHQGGHKPYGHFKRSWEDQLNQRHLNRFFSVVLLRIQPMDQATGSWGWSLTFASVGAVSGQSIQRGPPKSPGPKDKG